MKHATSLNYVSLEQLAEDVGNLRYDALATFLNLLDEKLTRDSYADLQRERIILSTLLEAGATGIMAAREAIQQAWDICEPHMKELNAEVH